MAQQLADTFEITATGQYPSGEGVSKAVSIDSGKAGCFRTSGHDVTDRGASHRCQRCQASNEHVTFTVLGVPDSQVLDESVTDVCGHRQNEDSPILPNHAQRCLMPVDIVEAQSSDFTDSYPQAREHDDDRQIAFVHRGVGIDGVDERGDLVSRKSFGKTGRRSVHGQDQA